MKTLKILSFFLFLGQLSVPLFGQERTTYYRHA